MPKQRGGGELVQGTLDMLVLRTLARGSMHGYAIAVTIERHSEDVLRVEEGSLYPALHRLELAGLLTSEWRMSETNRRAKYYRLTAAAHETSDGPVGQLESPGAGHRPSHGDLMRWWLKLRKRRTLDRELRQEIAFHREMRARDKERPPFGNETQIQEELRDMWTFVWLETAWQDVRYALRGIRRNPGFASTAILSLALGIGASVAIFTVVDNMLLRPLPYRTPENLVMVWEVNSIRDVRNNVISPANYLDWKARNHVFSGMAGLGFQGTIAFSEGGSPAEELGYRSTTPEFFPLLGVTAHTGRVFTPDDARTGAKRVALISDRLWRRHFGGDPAVTGKVVNLDGAAATIAGVLPPGFYFLDRDVDVWMPLALDPARNYRATSGRFMSCVARLRPGVTLKAARAEMSAIGQQLWPPIPPLTRGGHQPWRRFAKRLYTKSRRPFMFCSEPSACCLAWLALTSQTCCCRDFPPGSMNSRYVFLSAPGEPGSLARCSRNARRSVAWEAWAGVAVSYFAIRGLVRLAPRDMSWAGDLTIDFRILGFAMALSMMTGLLVGLIPATVASRRRAGSTLRQHQRTGGSGQRLRWLLVGAEVALGVLLMTGAGLLFRTFVRLQASPSGYDARNLLTMKVSLAGEDYRESAARVRFFDDTTSRVPRYPGCGPRPPSV